MTSCARSCCWVPMAGICATNRACPCHRDDTQPTTRNNGGVTHSDPTANTAVRNVMKQQKGK